MNTAAPHGRLEGAWAPVPYDPAPAPPRASRPRIAARPGSSTSAPWMPLVPGVVMPQMASASWDGFTVDCWGPGLFSMLVDEDVQSFHGLNAVLIGGESSGATHARRFLEKDRDTRLINLYGPLECGILVTSHDITLARLLVGGWRTAGRRRAAQRALRPRRDHGRRRRPGGRDRPRRGRAGHRLPG